jgi:hypothetical protein
LWLLPLVLVPLAVGPTSAGIIFGKKSKKPPTPAERVPELLAQVKSDGDEAAAPPPPRNCDNTIRPSFP